MTQDMYGLPVTNASEAAMQGINDFIHGFIAFEPKATNVMGCSGKRPRLLFDQYLHRDVVDVT